MRKIQEEDVKDVLKNGVKELQEIHSRLLALYEELGDTDALIRSVSINRPQSDSVGGSAGGLNKDLTAVMLKHEKLAKQREIEIREEMLQLTEDEETINRIRVCYQTLRGNEYAFLFELYVKERPYKFVEEHSGVSHSRFEAIRKKAINKIIGLYDSNCSNQEIITRRQKGCKKKRREDAIYQQLELDLKI